MEGLILYEECQLRNPCLIAGFSGWANAGEVSTMSLMYLISGLKAKKLAKIDGEDFYILTTTEVHRPVTKIEKGIIKELELPEPMFYLWKNENGNDLLFLLGREPDMHWRKYLEIVIGFAKNLGIKRIYTIGGEYAAVPHTRNPKISAVVSDERLKEELSQYEIRTIDYQGPSSIHTYFSIACKEGNIECISLWGNVPYYIQVANPKVSSLILEKLAQLLKIEIPIDQIKKEGKEFEEQVNKAVSEKPDIQEFIKKLEEIYDADREVDRPSRQELEEFIKGVEDFLRRQDKE
jgi:proteasome assembly chaperone (PAC2) family protein